MGERSKASNRYRRPIEFRHAKSPEFFVIAAILITQTADRDGLAELERLGGVRTPMHTRYITPVSHVRGDFVEFPADSLRVTFDGPPEDSVFASLVISVRL